MPAEDATEDPQAVQEGPKNDTAVLNGRFEILPGNRLPAFDNGPAKAYAARAAGQAQAGFFALVCESGLVPRVRYAATFSTIMNPNLVKLIASGVVYWPPDGGYRYVFVYENNLGRPLMQKGGAGGLGWKQEQVMSAVIKPLVNVLLDLRDADLVHGCINPYNMFDGGAEIVDKAILGECLSLPPSMSQPALFEPVERAMTDPVARGMGTFEDDLYAFGVTLTVILRHRDPMEGMTDEDIIRQKVEMGSYAALTGKERFTGGLLELLRGLLYDDRVQRWTLDEVMTWLGGQRLSPKQSAKKQKAARPVHFNGERYFRPALLAMDLEKNQAEAVQMIESGHLNQWIERSLEDSVIGERYQKALDAVQDYGRGPGYWDLLLSRMSVALDPEAPVRYKGLKLNPEGLPCALAKAVYDGGDVAPFAEIVNHQLVIFWLQAQQDMRVDVGTLLPRYDACRTYLRQPTMGYGIERCLYFLNRECPCFSPKLKGFYVTTPEELMLAFEEIAKRPDRPALFIDRHIAAFLSVKDRKDVDAYFLELNAPEHYKRVLGNLKTIATIQQRGRMKPLPGVASWVADVVEPLYERYHDRTLRTALQEKVKKLKAGGDISKIAAVFDDADLRKKDFQGFRAAMIEYAKLREEHAELEEKMAKPESFGKETGNEVASVVSCFLAGVIILAFAFLYFTNKGIL